MSAAARRQTVAGEGSMNDYEVFEVPNVLLQKGGTLPVARIAY